MRVDGDVLIEGQAPGPLDQLHHDVVAYPAEPVRQLRVAVVEQIVHVLRNHERSFICIHTQKHVTHTERNTQHTQHDRQTDDTRKNNSCLMDSLIILAE